MSQTGRRYARNWKGRFLQEFAQSGNVSRAARVAAVERTTVYVAKVRDTEFAEGWAAALAQAADLIRREVFVAP